MIKNPIHGTLGNFKLILGSASPRRSEILKRAKIPYSKRVITVEETYPKDLELAYIPVYLAEKKARGHTTIAELNEIILTADSLVFLDKQVLGKPNDRDHAIQILEKLSGKTHSVVTGCCLWHSTYQKSFGVHSEVRFSELSRTEIEFYIDTYQPFDKAGAYGIQDWIGCNKVESINGSYFNIMGLPIERVYHELAEFVKVINRF